MSLSEKHKILLLQAGFLNRESVLLQDARCAALGECYHMVETMHAGNMQGGVTFEAWYSSEVRAVLDPESQRSQQVCNSANDEAML